MTEPNGHVPDEHEAIGDDAIIGTAFRWSLIVFAIIAVIIVLIVFLRFERAAQPIVIEKEIDAPEALVADLAVLPDVQFTDITKEAGLHVPHVSGAEGEKLLPETMGGGAAFVDLDGDDDQDLLLVSGAWWGHSARSATPTSTKAYLNDGAGAFTPAAAWDVGHGMQGTGLACGDWDADGRIDVFLAGLQEDRLYRNTGQGFVDVTTEAGMAGAKPQWSTSPAFLDIDGDGDLDLFVPHYVRWSREIDQALNFTLNGTDRAYGPPKQYAGTHPTMWRNKGDGMFEDVSASSGMTVLNQATGDAVGKSLATAPVDIDSDGDMDLIVANDTTRNFLYRNRGDGTFEEDGVSAGVAYDARGNATGAMGIDVGHYRNDAALGIGIGNFANEMTSFYVCDHAGGWFTDEAVVEGIGAPTRPQLSFGLLLMDYDLDGRLDLFQTNGHLEEEINEVQASQHYRQPAQLFWNAGDDLGFRIVPSESAGDLGKPMVGRGATAADIDSDGDLDLLVTQPGELPTLLRNDQSLGHHWLRVRLSDTASANRDGIGAWIELDSGGVTQRRQVMPTRSYLSQVPASVTFGLGDLGKIDALRVQWPDGAVENIEPPVVDQSILIQRSSG